MAHRKFDGLPIKNGGSFHGELLVITIWISVDFSLIGGFNPPEKYESQIGSSSQLLAKIKHVPNHQPVNHY